MEPFQLIFSLPPSAPAGSSSFSLSFNHSQRGERTHSSLEFNALPHCWRRGPAVSLKLRLISPAEITELPIWRRGDDGLGHYCHGNVSWER